MVGCEHSKILLYARMRSCVLVVRYTVLFFEVRPVALEPGCCDLTCLDTSVHMKPSEGDDDETCLLEYCVMR